MANKAAESATDLRLGEGAGGGASNARAWRSGRGSKCGSDIDA